MSSFNERSPAPALTRARPVDPEKGDLPRVTGRQLGIGKARQRIGRRKGTMVDLYAAGAPHAATQRNLGTARFGASQREAAGVVGRFEFRLCGRSSHFAFGASGDISQGLIIAGEARNSDR